MKINITTLKEYLNNVNQIDTKDFKFISESIKNSKKIIDLESSLISSQLLEYIVFNDDVLSNDEKAFLTLKYLNVDNHTQSETFWETKIRGLNTIIDAFEANLKGLKYNFDYELDGKLIPVFVSVRLINATKYCPRHILINYNLLVLSDVLRFEHKIFSDHINEFKINSTIPNFENFFLKFNLLPQKTDLTKYEKLVSKAKLKQEKTGMLLRCLGNGFKTVNLNYVSLNYDKVIVEETLEYEKSSRFIDHPKDLTELPYVRVFSLNKKQYFYVHYNDLSDYEFDKKSVDNLLIDEKNKNIIQKIFSKNNMGFNDLVRDKGGGAIILAVGEPGTGKTTTAELFAEKFEKSLYIMQVEELGVNISSIEKNLEKILTRINRWNSILLFDEIDIFLSHRNNNLEKSAIVGVFLRLLEYFNGVIFFTSNRLDVIDRAVLSRVTVVIKYPNLNKKIRKKIWMDNFERANLKINSAENLATIEMSGRDIRNYVKLCSYIYDKAVEEENVLSLIKEFPKNAETIYNK